MHDTNEMIDFQRAFLLAAAGEEEGGLMETALSVCAFAVVRGYTADPCCFIYCTHTHTRSVSSVYGYIGIGCLIATDGDIHSFFLSFPNLQIA